MRGLVLCALALAPAATAAGRASADTPGLDPQPYSATYRVAEAGDAWVAVQQPADVTAAGEARPALIELGNSEVGLTFRPADGGPVLLSLRAAGGTDWLALSPTREIVLEYDDVLGRRHTDADLRYAGYGTTQEPSGALSLTLRYLDPQGVGVQAQYRLWPGAAAVERVLSVSNRAFQPIRLRRLAALSTRLSSSDGGDNWMAAVATADMGIHHQSLAAGETFHVGVPVGSGVPQQTIPSVVVTHAGADGGVFAGLAWSANFVLEVTRGAGGVTIEGGERLAGLTLDNGEEFEAAAAFVGAYRGSLDDAARAQQRFLDIRHLPAAGGRMDVPPVTWNSWFAYGSGVSEARLMAEADAAAGVGVEVFYVDHGWQRGFGDWHPRSDRFTDGSLATLASHVRARGMRFGLWVAFGLADPDSPVAVEHPEWLAPLPYPVPTFENARMLCLAPARDWVVAELSRLVDEYQLDWLKFDQAMIASCVPSGADPSAVAASVRANTLAFYDILATLRAKYPHLVIENCYNGGGYLDYALYGLTDVAWLTDGAGHGGISEVWLQQALAGATRALPADYLTVWLAQQPGPDPDALAYRALSTMGGAWGLSFRLTELTDQQLHDVRLLVERYRTLRRYIAEGELHHLSEPSDDGWLALAYVMPGGEDAAVLAVRNALPGAPPERLSLAMSGLVPDATYRVWEDVWQERLAGGPALDSDSLTLELGGHEGTIVYLSRVS